MNSLKRLEAGVCCAGEKGGFALLRTRFDMGDNIKDSCL